MVDRILFDGFLKVHSSLRKVSPNKLEHTEGSEDLSVLRFQRAGFVEGIFHIVQREISFLLEDLELREVRRVPQPVA